MAGFHQMGYKPLITAILTLLSQMCFFFFHSPSSPLTWTVISQLGYKDDVGDCVKTLVRVNVDSIL